MGRPDSMKHWHLVVAALGLGLATANCGGGGDTPTRPAPLPPGTAFVPTAPAPQPTPTPIPGTTPDEEPYPAVPRGGGSASCGAPTPPPVSRMNVKLHMRQSERSVLDSTPLVGPDAAYCQKIGFTDGRTMCPVRPEGHPEREACEAARVGRASDTGRPGPTWSANGKRCNGPDGAASCANHPDNQYLVFAYGSGTFRACTASGVCGEVTLP
jgi:hypothetical protein